MYWAFCSRSNVALLVRLSVRWSVRVRPSFALLPLPNRPRQSSVYPALSLFFAFALVLFLFLDLVVFVLHSRFISQVSPSCARCHQNTRQRSHPHQTTLTLPSASGPNSRSAPTTRLTSNPISNFLGTARKSSAK